MLNHIELTSSYGEASGLCRSLKYNRHLQKVRGSEWKRKEMLCIITYLNSYMMKAPKCKTLGVELVHA